MVTRLHAIALAQGGKTAPRVAQEIGYSRRGVRFRVRWYNRRGGDRLGNGGGQGRKPTLDEGGQQELRGRPGAGPLAEGDGGGRTLRGLGVRRASSGRSSARSAASARPIT